MFLRAHFFTHMFGQIFMKTLFQVIFVASSALLFINPGVGQDAIPEYQNIAIKYELSDHNGKQVTEADLSGKYTLLAFGFTRCAHICPMMAATMAMTLKVANEDAAGVFISVDTERDSAADANAFASGFHASMIGLSGTHEQIQSAANNFGISYVVTKSQKNYTVEHTSDIFLIGPDGKLIDVFALNAPPQRIAKAMQVIK